eukprot:1679017-Karenia_brevis.AAC.1
MLLRRVILFCQAHCELRNGCIVLRGPPADWLNAYVSIIHDCPDSRSTEHRVRIQRANAVLKKVGPAAGCNVQILVTLAQTLLPLDDQVLQLINLEAILQERCPQFQPAKAIVEFVEVISDDSDGDQASEAQQAIVPAGAADQLGDIILNEMDRGQLQTVASNALLLVSDLKRKLGQAKKDLHTEKKKSRKLQIAVRDVREREEAFVAMNNETFVLDIVHIPNMKSKLPSLLAAGLRRNIAHLASRDLGPCALVDISKNYVLKAEVITAAHLNGYARNWYEAHELERVNALDGVWQPEELEQLDTDELDRIESQEDPPPFQIGVHSMAGDATSANVFKGSSVHSMEVWSAYLLDSSKLDDINEDGPDGVSNRKSLCSAASITFNKWLTDVLKVDRKNTASIYSMVLKQLNSIGTPTWVKTRARKIKEI